MSNLRVLVVGASIAGPSTAYWLARAGCHVTVIERFPSLRRGGQAIDIRTFGVAVMRKMAGMEAQVRLKSTQEEGVCFVHSDGTLYGTIRATGNPERQGIVSEFEIFRSDLSQVLFGLTKSNPNIRYIFDEQILSISGPSISGSVTVSFANRTKPQDFDLVVACDGATSRTRAMGFECGVRDHIEATGQWAAYFSLEEDVLKGNKIGHGFSAPGGRFVSVGSDPAGGSRVMFMSINKANNDTVKRFRDAASKGDGALKEVVDQEFQGAGWKTDSLLEGMMESRDFYASEIVQVKMPTLSRGRVVLVGDAGYAAGPTGGGTSLALTGGYMLAGELLKHQDDLTAGLRGYEERMQPLIQEMQKMPPFVGTIMAPQTAWGIWIRNWAFAIVAWTGVAEFLGQYLGAAFADSKQNVLPEYEWVELRLLASVRQWN